MIDRWPLILHQDVGGFEVRLDDHRPTSGHEQVEVRVVGHEPRVERPGGATQLGHDPRVRPQLQPTRERAHERERAPVASEAHATVRRGDRDAHRSRLQTRHLHGVTSDHAPERVPHHVHPRHTEAITQLLGPLGALIGQGGDVGSQRVVVQRVDAAEAGLLQVAPKEHPVRLVGAVAVDEEHRRVDP